MTISFNPQVSFNSKAKQEPKTVTAFTPDGQKMILSLEETPKKRGIKGAASKVANFFVNLSEGAKGLFRGVFYGALGGTAIAAVDWVTKGAPRAFAKIAPVIEDGAETATKEAIKAAKSLRAKNIKEFFTKPAKYVSKGGKVVAALGAAVLLTAELVRARLHANKKTANVDHQLRVDHRDNGKKSI